MRKPDAVLTIAELTRAVKQKLEQDPALQQVWVRGEISNFKHHSSGHMYFTLKDQQSRIRCVMFSSFNRRLAFMPKDGAMVLALGDVSVYERDGQYQFYVQDMQPDGIGSLYMAYEQLKNKLENEGLFSPAHKRQIPAFPRTVGVITSPTGAAVRDIITTLQRRLPSVSILLYPAVVQGKNAAPSICRAIELMNELGEADVLIVGRGGGSLEELWAFNEESVARSIFHSNIPVISAVGHETDVTIADFVADVRAATPTAAAELAVPHHMELRQRLLEMRQRLHRGLMTQYQMKKEKLQQLKKSSVLADPLKHLAQPTQKLDRLQEQLLFRMKQHLQFSYQKVMKLEQAIISHHPGGRIKHMHEKVSSLRRQLHTSANHNLMKWQTRLQSNIRQLDALSPLKVMQRGYSLVYDEKEKAIIKSIKQLQPGDPIKVRLTDGKLDCQVWSMEEEHDGERNEF